MFKSKLLLGLVLMAFFQTGCIIVNIQDPSVFDDAERPDESEFAPRLSEPRLRPLESEDLNEEQKAMMDAIPAPMANLNIFKTLVRAPKLMQSFAPLGTYLVGQSTLPARDREVVILRTAWNAEAEYEWGQHTRIARSMGMTEEDFARIASGPDADGLSTPDATLLTAVDELFFDTMIHDDTWKALGSRYSEEQIIELAFTVGEYNMIAMALNSAGVQLEEGVAGFPEE